MKKLLGILLYFVTLQISAQVISGIVVDSKKNPIALANVYLEGTYDGATTNDLGEFSFSTAKVGSQNLVVSFLSFETFTMLGDISYMNDLTIILKDDINTLDTVILSAGTFSAGDNSKVNALKPMDVVTTAGALGDFVGALQTLPGTTTVAEDGRLFVRGGDAEETQIFIDGIRVFTPYSPTTNNIPTRGRYSPFLFDGITFSTGGYSAEFGQALSSVLLLNTTGVPDQQKTDIGIMTVGGAIGNTQKWKKNSLSVNASYINLAPYIAVFDDRNDWQKPVESIAGEVVFRQELGGGMLKFYSAFDTSNFELTQDDINIAEGVNFSVNNRNLYFNTSYKGMLNANWTLETGLSYTNAHNNNEISTAKIDNNENSFHAKLKLKHRFNNRFKFNVGAEYFATDLLEDYQDTFTPKVNYGFNNNISAVFSEADIFFSKKLALKAGLRLENSELFNELTFSPRLSMAYKTSVKSQISLAYGDFYQNPNSHVLKFEQDLEAQKTTHYIFNYQYNNDGQLFRAEAYFKDYDKLVKYDSEYASFDSNYSNYGYGFAKGIDLFWRDSRSVKNVDYWLSYSYLDTKRNYQNYPIEAQPDFANTHNLSMVGKYWIEDWRSQVGMSYNFASGRTYTNPNMRGFLNDKTKAYNNFSVNWAYLISPQKILYFSINNVFGFSNVNGYQFADVPDMNGDFARRNLIPAADQFFFVGFFWTISEKGTDNQLDNL